MSAASVVGFSVQGKDYFAQAGSEIILGAGTFQSPQILELSEIGSNTLLEKNGIEIIVENPHAGENFHDHVLVPLTYKVLEGLPTAKTIKQTDVLDWALNEWMQGRGGPLATGVSGTGFMSYPPILPDSIRTQEMYVIYKSLESESEINVTKKQFQLQKQEFFKDSEADVQFSMCSTGLNPYSSDKLAELFQHEDLGNHSGFVTVSIHPFSRSSPHIASADPTVTP